MEIKLSGKDALAIIGVVVTEAIIACVAIKKAVKAEQKANEKALKASIYEFDSFMKDLRIEDLEKENTRLKSLCNEEES